MGPQRRSASSRQVFFPSWGAAVPGGASQRPSSEAHPLPIASRRLSTVRVWGELLPRAPRFLVRVLLAEYRIRPVYYLTLCTAKLDAAA